MSLEKHNYVNKLITKLEIDNKLIHDPAMILSEQSKFYENLYSEKLDITSEKYISAIDFLFKPKIHPCYQKNRKLNVIMKLKKKKY